jgi:two-component system chemotaxis response regulator CheB
MGITKMPENDAMRCDVVVIGASAGGVEALQLVVGQLPADLAAAVFVILHMSPDSPSVLPQILGRAGALDARNPIDGETIEPGRVYVAPPDTHMRVRDGRIVLDRGPRENGHRPAIDPLFYSASELSDCRAIGVVLSGARDDGAAGLATIATSGGSCLVQSPSEALYRAMPEAALGLVPDAFVGTAREIGTEIVRLVREPKPDASARIDGGLKGSTTLAGEVSDGVTAHPQPGETTGFTCPECHGSLWQSEKNGILRFRCRTGHEFAPESLLFEQAEHVERALWAALRALEEKADMLTRMSTRASTSARTAVAARFALRATETAGQAFAVRSVIEQMGSTEADTDTDTGKAAA